MMGCPKFLSPRTLRNGKTGHRWRCRKSNRIVKRTTGCCDTCPTQEEKS